MAALLLFTLLLASLAVVLHAITGVLMHVFKQLDLLISFSNAHLKITQRLHQLGVLDFDGLPPLLLLKAQFLSGLQL